MSYPYMTGNLFYDVFTLN